MTTPLTVYAADISKRHLHVGTYPPSGSLLLLANSSKTISAWLETLPIGSVIGMEATGAYHRTLADLAYTAGMRVYVLNPRDVYYYAHGLGARAKTDASDAQLIARYLAHEQAHLHPYVPASPTEQTVIDLLNRRARFVRLRMSLSMSLKEMPDLKNVGDQAIEALNQVITALDTLLTQVQKQAPELGEQTRRLRSTPGIGPLNSLLLATLVQRFRFTKADSIVAYVGLDPTPNDSGEHHGRRRLSKHGHPEWRRLLVAAAKSAARCPVWAPFVQRFQNKGLPATAIHVILARKLIHVAFALLKHKTPFDPSLAPHA
jgi:transposase